MGRDPATGLLAVCLVFNCRSLKRPKTRSLLNNGISKFSLTFETGILDNVWLHCPFSHQAYIRNLRAHWVMILTCCVFSFKRLEQPLSPVSREGVTTKAGHWTRTANSRWKSHDGKPANQKARIRRYTVVCCTCFPALMYRARHSLQLFLPKVSVGCGNR